MDKLSVALEIEQKQRQLDVLMTQQRQQIAELLLLCQAYLDTMGEV